MSEKGPEIFYVVDGFDKESWHYAANEESAKRAHKYHHFGNEGVRKAYRDETLVRATVAPSFFGAVCTETQCAALAGIPYAMIERAERERIGGNRRS